MHKVMNGGRVSEFSEATSFLENLHVVTNLEALQTMSHVLSEYL